MQHDSSERTPAKMIEVFVQGEGKQLITIVRVPPSATVQDLLGEVVRLGLLGGTEAEKVGVFLEDADTELGLKDHLQTVGVAHRSRVHFNRCRKVGVTVHFNGGEKLRVFTPSASIGKVFEWAVGSHGFNLTPTDAVEHVLQVTGSSARPDEDVHLGALTQAPACAVAFDLVPKRRVEG